MNYQEQVKIEAAVRSLEGLFKTLCDDVDALRDTVAQKILDASPEVTKRSKETKDREIESLEKLFANVPKNKNMKKESK